jgi:hypothetical protein
LYLNAPAADPFQLPSLIASKLKPYPALETHTLPDLKARLEAQDYEPSASLDTEKIFEKNEWWWWW